MQNIDKEEARELLTIIPRDYPSQDIYHLTENCGVFAHKLHDLCKSQGYLLDLMIPDSKEFENIAELKAHKFYYNKNRYNRHSRVYDFVFVSIDLEKIEDIDTFYKKIYAISKNGGKVLFFVDNSCDIRALEDRLIKHNYVAVNPIENTFKNYQILGAVKMHGWDN